MSHPLTLSEAERIAEGEEREEVSRQIIILFFLLDRTAEHSGFDISAHKVGRGEAQSESAEVGMEGEHTHTHTHTHISLSVLPSLPFSFTHTEAAG